MTWKALPRPSIKGMTSNLSDAGGYYAGDRVFTPHFPPVFRFCSMNSIYRLSITPHISLIRHSSSLLESGCYALLLADRRAKRIALSEAKQWITISGWFVRIFELFIRQFPGYKGVLELEPFYYLFVFRRL